ncbi:MAG: VOC family protein [Oscillibacter sp.]|jgi:catechol 2,3-dioxygenase-like lactoylglutathione lyase family enzyme|nr:VOC family protein [Oscillibacter sp.]
MEFKSPLLAVSNLEKSLKFYKDVLDLEVLQDFGANVTLSGGISLQTEESWLDFLDKPRTELQYGGNDFELYFVTEDFDGFLKTLEEKNVQMVRPPMEHRWGQRVVRIYDPDQHILEIAEPLSEVCRRFRNGGLSEEGIARRMDVSLELVKKLLKT